MEILTINIDCDKCAPSVIPSQNYDTNKILFILACGHKFYLAPDEIVGYKMLSTSYYMFDVAIPDNYIFPNTTNKILEYEEFDNDDIYCTPLRRIIYDYIETSYSYELGCYHYPFDDEVQVGDIIICDLNNLKIMGSKKYFDENVYPYLLTRIAEGCVLIDMKTSSNTPEFSEFLRILIVIPK